MLFIRAAFADRCAATGTRGGHMQLKRALAKLMALAAVIALGGLLFAWSGVYSVAASAGHWPMVSWFLQFTMRNSVETHAMALDPPPLDDPALVERGAGHYETGCLPCHGAPGAPSNRIPNHMLPEPPYLPAHIDSWTPEELFWIVKHGLKYTGMPAWPAQERDDEVWAVTAFLRRLPGLAPEEYAALAEGAGAPVPAGGDPPIPEQPGQLFTMSDAALIGACVRCHGVEGVGRPSGAFPRLDIQAAEYIYRALDEYASGARPSGIMQPVAAALGEDDMRRLAHHYAVPAARSAENRGQPDVGLVELGRRIATAGVTDRQIAPCQACHGLQEGPQNALFPSLAGQYADYTILQLRLWKQGKHCGGAFSEIMEPIVAAMTDEEMRAVALFYEGLPGQSTREGEAAPAVDEEPRSSPPQ
jgi:cytochrome c553